MNKIDNVICLGNNAQAHCSYEVVINDHEGKELFREVNKPLQQALFKVFPYLIAVIREELVDEMRIQSEKA